MISDCCNSSCCSNDKKDEDSIEKSKLCPKCKHDSIEVNEITVRHLIIDEEVKNVINGNYHICLDSNCDVVYFNTESNVVFNKNNIKVPIWYKQDANPKYICYCNRVTEKDIIDAVIEKKAKNIKDIIRLTGAMKNSNCIINNPIGKCCSSNIISVINNT